MLQVGNGTGQGPTPPGIVSFPLRLFMSWTPKNQTPALPLIDPWDLGQLLKSSRLTDPDQ